MADLTTINCDFEDKDYVFFQKENTIQIKCQNDSGVDMDFEIIFYGQAAYANIDVESVNTSVKLGTKYIDVNIIPTNTLDCRILAQVIITQNGTLYDTYNISHVYEVTGYTENTFQTNYIKSCKINDKQGTVIKIGNKIAWKRKDVLCCPEFIGNDTAIQQFSNDNYFTQQNGIATFKGAVLANGWENTNEWFASFDLAYLDGLKYTGLILLADVDDPFGDWGIRGWEGPITAQAYTQNAPIPTDGEYLTSLPENTNIVNNPIVNWQRIYMQKYRNDMGTPMLDVWTNETQQDRFVYYNYYGLDDPDRVTIGGMTNGHSSETQSQYGSVYIKNLIVLKQ